MRKKTDSYLGFAKKSGNLLTGANTCMWALEKGKTKLLIVTCDTAEGSREKIIRKAEKAGVPYRIYGSSDDLSHAAGESGRNMFAVTDTGLAESLINAIDEENKEKEVL